jgi:hypothetical protein
MSARTYRFFSHVGRGLAARGRSDDAGGPVEQNVAFRLRGGEEENEPIPPFDLLGPGEVTGLLPSQVVRMSPAPGSDVHEPNYLAHIEFAHPDLPWLFTPRAPEGANKKRLMPWIALVVLELDTRAGEDAVRPGTPNPRIRISPALLPDLDEAWAWAHTQVVVEEGGPLAEDVLRRWENYPGRTVSRLLCPRQLAPERDYLACVVPYH